MGWFWAPLMRRGFLFEKPLRVMLRNGLRVWPNMGWVWARLMRRGFQNEKPLPAMSLNGLRV